MLDTDNITYSIGHVAEIADIAQSTIRYWETVFDILDPIKTAGGSRRYTKMHIELILKIKDLLHNQGFTIKGANQYFKNPQKTRLGSKMEMDDKYSPDNAVESPSVNTARINLKYVKNELIKIRKILE